LPIAEVNQPGEDRGEPARPLKRLGLRTPVTSPRSPNAMSPGASRTTRSPLGPRSSRRQIAAQLGSLI